MGQKEAVVGVDVGEENNRLELEAEEEEKVSLLLSVVL